MVFEEEYKVKLTTDKRNQKIKHLIDRNSKRPFIQIARLSES